MSEHSAGYPVTGRIYYDPLRDALLVYQATVEGIFHFTYLLHPENETKRKPWEMNYLHPMSEMEAIAWIANGSPAPT